MIDRIAIRPNDRVLLLSIPEPAGVQELAAKLSKGLVVGLGNEEEVQAARRAAADVDNAMFVTAGPEDIPWRDGFFSLAIAFECRWNPLECVTQELARVVGPGGSVHLHGGERWSGHLAAAGFLEIRLDGDGVAARR